LTPVAPPSYTLAMATLRKSSITHDAAPLSGAARVNVCAHLQACLASIRVRYADALS